VVITANNGHTTAWTSTADSSPVYLLRGCTPLLRPCLLT
jgi:hypothetical protein